MTNKQTIKGVLDKCRECGSTSLTWQATSHNNSSVVEGRLRTGDVTSMFILGCDECSETLKTVCADEMAGHLNAGKVSAQSQGEVERLRAELAERDALLERCAPQIQFYFERLCSDSAEEIDIGMAGQLVDDLKALSTSAEPKPRGDSDMSRLIEDISAEKERSRRWMESSVEATCAAADLNSQVSHLEELLKSAILSGLDGVNISTGLSVRQEIEFALKCLDEGRKFDDGDLKENSRFEIYSFEIPNPVIPKIVMGNIGVKAEVSIDGRFAPVAVVLPERMHIPAAHCPERINAQGWNACLDKVAKLNGLKP